MSLAVQITADSKFPVDRKRLRKALVEAWESIGIETDVNVSLAVVGTRKMAALHQQYLHKSGPTDVLAFPQHSLGRDDLGFITSADVPLELGDIVVCFPLALEQAVEKNILVDEKIEQLVVHGFRNLMGEAEENKA